MQDYLAVSPASGQIGWEPLTRIIADRLGDPMTTRSPGNLWSIDLAGKCERPVVRGVHARKQKLGHAVDRRLLRAEVAFRCRKCHWCLRQRAGLWAHRATAEINRAVRTWFVTLTLRPASRYQMLARSLVRVSNPRTESEEFRCIHEQAAKEITLYLKRIRRESGAKLRFMCVAERHKSGDVHYHLLVHEQEGVTVKHRTLVTQWPLGFAFAKLVYGPAQSAARYAAKYISKAIEARVRGSIRYGDASSPNDIVGESLNVSSKDPPSVGGAAAARARVHRKDAARSAARPTAEAVSTIPTDEAPPGPPPGGPVLWDGVVGSLNKGNERAWDTQCDGMEEEERAEGAADFQSPFR